MLWVAAGATALHLADVTRLFDVLTLPASWDSALRQPWSLLTYMVTQISPLHLLFNMLWLYWFGMLLEDCTRRGAILALFIAGGLCGALLFLLSADPWEGNLAGASAASLALVTAAACRMPSRRIPLLLFGNVRLVWIAVIPLAQTFPGGGGAMAAGFTAHLGGAIAGCVYGVYPLILTPIKEKLEDMRRRRRMNPKALKDIHVVMPGSRSVFDSKARAENRARLDTLLDKIRLTGYDSLTSAERRELEVLSQNI